MFKHAHSKPSINIVSLGLFEIVVAVQSTFRLEMHQNDIFYFKKIIFEINTSKRSEKIKNI
jgi:acyl carrier protein